MIASTLVTFIMMLSVIAEKPKPDAQPICLKFFPTPAAKPPVTPGHKLAVVDQPVERRVRVFRSRDVDFWSFII